MDRIARYAAKFAHARNRLDLFKEWSADAQSSMQALLASYKAFQEVAEALLDVCAMVVKDRGEPPKDDYTNLDALKAAGVLSLDVATGLATANGLRNRLVHEYNGLWDDVAIEAAVELVPVLNDAMKELEAWINS